MKQESLGGTSPEAVARYNKVRAEEFLTIRTKFYAKFPTKLDCDYSCEDLIFMKYDEFQESLVHIKNVLKAAITQPNEIAKDWKEHLVVFIQQNLSDDSTALRRGKK